TKDQSIIAENRPTRVCLDVCWKGTLTSVWEVQHTITTSRTLTDYVKDGIQHYVFALAIIDAAGNVTDLRPKGSQAERRSESTLADHERSRNHPDATLDAKGFTQLSSATDSESESLAATPKAVKRAMDNASARLAKDRNGDDIPDKSLFIENLGLKPVVDKADDAVQRKGDTMSGELKLRGTRALRIFNDAFGAFFHRLYDGLYLTTTPEGQGENGTVGGLDCFIINLRTGKVTLNSGGDVNGDLYVGSNMTVRGGLTIGSGPMTGFKNNSGNLEVYCNNNHVFLFKNGIFESHKPVNISGRVTPSDYGNFDARYSQRTDGTQNIRLGAEAWYSPGGNEISWNFHAP
ncbi:phage tail protein, partial [Escherichia coli]|nr:phage tail protein [Escherichia coli]